MPRPDVEIAILGGGCAGLSVAVRLAAAGHSLRVIEPRAAYSEDRAWSFWRTAPDPFEDCVRASWAGWDITGPGGRVHRASRKLRYQSVGAGAFYDRAQALLDDARGAALSLGTAAHDFRKTAQGWQIETASGAFTARHVIDTRPPKRVPGYGQFFLGREIRTDRPVFDPGVVQLMQFRPARSAGVDFVYILPYARDVALVEVTSFAPRSPGRAVFETWLAEEIDALAAGPHEVLREEQGALPMQVGFHDPAPAGCIRMGLGGGAARPSTGYAFARIQRQADMVARALATGRDAPGALDGPFSRFMDRVFLQVIQTVPERGPALFESLFRNTAPDRLEHFLSGSIHPVDRLSVMTSLPTVPFLRAALRPA
jgi:lycopene beta-cyclase